MSRRLFVSVDLDELADDIAAVQERFADASGLRFTEMRGESLALQRGHESNMICSKPHDLIGS
jgi:2'-5' RNA ligase